MSKVNFYNIPDNEKSIIFQHIANAKNMAPFAVEKDWWVVQTLAVIFEMGVAENLVFKGGTSLSKAWKLISEDIDFAQPPINVPTVNPERTFLEKIFLLHEEFHRPHEKMRVDRLSRHLYDVYKLSRTDFAEKALKDRQLYETIVEHRYKFTRIGGVDYNLHQPQTINMLPIPQVLEAWKADYKTMLEQMIYEEKPPSFDEIIMELTRLKDKINALTWKFKNQFSLPSN
jgi:predicted nucleotidyltransferase component of viral defense system